MNLAARVQDAPTDRAALGLIAEALESLLKPVEIPVKTPCVKHAEKQDVRRQELAAVWDHWMAVMNKRPGVSKFTSTRRDKVRARLVEGYSVEYIKKAIDGCAVSDFHMGRGEYQGQAKFHDLELICRTGAKLEWFYDRAPEAKDRTKWLG